MFYVYQLPYQPTLSHGIHDICAQQACNESWLNHEPYNSSLAELSSAVPQRSSTLPATSTWMPPAGPVSGTVHDRRMHHGRTTAAVPPATVSAFAMPAMPTTRISIPRPSTQRAGAHHPYPSYPVGNQGFRSAATLRGPTAYTQDFKIYILPYGVRLFYFVEISFTDFISSQKGLLNMISQVTVMLRADPRFVFTPRAFKTF